MKLTGLILLGTYTLFAVATFLMVAEYTYSALYFITGLYLWFKLKERIYK